MHNFYKGRQYVSMSHVVPFYCIIFSFILHIFERSFSLVFFADFFLEVDIDNRDEQPQCAPCPSGKQDAPPRKMQALPCPKIGKTCGAELGKVEFNPLKFRRVNSKKGTNKQQSQRLWIWIQQQWIQTTVNWFPFKSVGMGWDRLRGLVSPPL